MPFSKHRQCLERPAQGNPYRTFCHLTDLPGFGRTCPLYPDHLHDLLRPFVQHRDHFGHVGGLGRVWSSLGNQIIGKILDRQDDAAPADPKGIDQRAMA